MLTPRGTAAKCAPKRRAATLPKNYDTSPNLRWCVDRDEIIPVWSDRGFTSWEAARRRLIEVRCEDAVREALKEAGERSGILGGVTRSNWP
jgi:hypothetical protein